VIKALSSGLPWWVSPCACLSLEATYRPGRLPEQSLATSTLVKMSRGDQRRDLPRTHLLEVDRKRGASWGCDSVIM
jgi:hypothetical protein